jgi:hypothetical protein
MPGKGDSFEFMIRGSLISARGRKLTGLGELESWCWIRKLFADAAGPSLESELLDVSCLMPRGDSRALR